MPLAGPGGGGEGDGDVVAGLLSRISNLDAVWQVADIYQLACRSCKSQGSTSRPLIWGVMRLRGGCGRITMLR